MKANDEDIMIELQAGSSQAFSKIYDRYANRLHHFFWRGLNKDAELSSDLVHDLFLKIIEKPEVFDPKRKFKTWVFSVANNMLINEYKRRSVRSNVSDAPLDQFIGSNGHYRYHDQDRFIEALNALIVRFKPETQTLFFLRFREEMAVPEISEIMNVKEGTIKSRLHHLTKKLAVGLDEFKDLNHN